MIIDGHAHACGPFLEAGGVVELLDRNGVDKVVLVPGIPGGTKTYSLPPLAKWFPNRDVVFWTNLLTKGLIFLAGAARYIAEGNRYVHSLVTVCPARILQFYWVQLSRPDALDDLERDYPIFRFQGVKLHQCWESFRVDSDRFHCLAEWAESRGLPIFVHLFSTGQASRLAHYIQQHPRTRFIVAHLFGLKRYIESGLSSKNVLFETSAPAVISVARIMKAVAHFGADRVVLGSDTPFGRDNQAVNVRRVRNLDISDEAKGMILGDNIRQWLNLSDSPQIGPRWQTE